MAARLIAATLLLGLATLGHAQEAATERPPPRVSVAQARAREVVADVTVTGTLVARKEVLVTPQVEGLRVMSLFADVGDQVAAGQVLAKLDRATVETELAQADATIAKAEAGLAQAGAQMNEAEAALAEATAALERGEALRKSGTLNQAEYDQRVAAQKSAAARLAAAEAGAKVAEADLAAARAQRLTLELRLARTDVVAPERGVVIERNARIGAIASSVGDPMFRVIADGDVELEAEVIETMLPRIQAGDPAEVRVAGLGDVAGTVRLVSPEVDPQTRLGTVRILLGRDPNLRVGSFARGRIVTDRREAVTVPASAVLSDEDGAFVQVVVDGTIETRPVTTGILAGDDWEVTDGLREGEVVLARAGAFFQSGDRVTPVTVTGGERATPVAREAAAQETSP